MASKESIVMLKDCLHMNNDNEEISYAKNSLLQEHMIKKAHYILKETIKGIANDNHGFPECFRIADLGCSSGPNTLLTISNIVDEVHEVCKDKNIDPPQLQVCLNDLFGNDFNSIFQSLPMFYKEKGEKLGKCFISAVPGSFYGRLFPDHSMHFFHSSTSLHWLSQIPQGRENNGVNIYMGETSPPDVFEMYTLQFQKDFTTFLESRANEIVRGGRMFLTLGGRDNVDLRRTASTLLYELLGKSLMDVAKEGIIEESKVHSFNMPIYTPCKDEVKILIDNQGSFSIEVLETFEVKWDPYDTNINHGKNVAKILRAGWEPLLATYFGNSAMDMLFQKFEQYADTYMSTEKSKLFINMVISLIKI